jgi:hypothetical protein
MVVGASGSGGFRRSLEFPTQNVFLGPCLEARPGAGRIVNRKNMASNFRSPVN